MISFRGDYTKEQWTRGLRLGMFPSGRALYLRLLAMAIGVGAIALFIAGYVQGEPFSTTRILRAGISAVVLLSWAGLPYVRAWLAIREPWRSGRPRPSLQGTVTNEGIASDATAPGVVETWDSFNIAHVRDDLIVLGGSDGLATILPRDFFASENDWQAFRQLVQFRVVKPT